MPSEGFESAVPAIEWSQTHSIVIGEASAVKVLIFDFV
jgi:hypothetical protein